MCGCLVSWFGCGVGGLVFICWILNEGVGCEVSVGELRVFLFFFFLLTMIENWIVEDVLEKRSS